MSGAGRRGLTKFSTGKVPLTSNDVDIIAAYIVPRSIWYIVPIEQAPLKALWFNPQRSTRGARWEHFREAWDYLRAPDAGQILT